MLVNFRFKNNRSFYSETNLSMMATTDTELKGTNTFAVDESLMLKGDNEFVKSAVIFGGNASGKSNILKALAYMKNVLQLSASQYPIVASNEKFAFYTDSLDEDSLYEVEIIQNGTYYKYGFMLNPNGWNVEKNGLQMFLSVMITNWKSPVFLNRQPIL